MKAVTAAEAATASGQCESRSSSAPRKPSGGHFRLIEHKAAIHRSAWKGYSRQFIYEILHKRPASTSGCPPDPLPQCRWA